jgi:hypothetical protein
MLLKESKTGLLFNSKLKDCPVFIPNDLSMVDSDFVKKFDTNFPFTKIDERYNSILKVYLYKFISGGKNLEKDYADIDLLSLFMWNDIKISKNIYVKSIINSLNIFDKIISNTETLDKIDINYIVQCNKTLRNKKGFFGLRIKGMRAGDPKINPCAFYCVPENKIKRHLSTLVKYINNSDTDVLTKSLLIMMQFIFIHPFKDGNGRTSRVLFLALLKEKFGLPFTSLMLVYIKNVNRQNYYRAMKNYREGNINSLIGFYNNLILWVKKSTDELYKFILDYENKIKLYGYVPEKFKQKIIYSQNEFNNIDINSEFFEVVSIKKNSNCYINNSLLFVLNQFNHYLGFELRKNNL